MIKRKGGTWTRAGSAAAQLLALGLMSFLLGGGQSSAQAGLSPLRQSSSLAAATDAPTAPAIACGALVPIGTAAQPGGPDFTAIPGAPTRVTPADVNSAGAPSPEVCHVQGYIAPQV